MICPRSTVVATSSRASFSSVTATPRIRRETRSIAGRTPFNRISAPLKEVPFRPLLWIHLAPWHPCHGAFAWAPLCLPSMVGAKMDATFKATAIAHTKPTANGNSGELTLSDATGRKLTIDIGDGLARDLLSALQHLVERPSRTGPAATKMP